ncbi:transmembrane amino acid transporter protein-domain-containing protein [Mrakia frigida]|uniref:transmembrane amino acid transporter protein-domain-containing protein n=1 Tax=Mrakia frigida TaxID=29902 RepID=UPI003FCBF8A0
MVSSPALSTSSSSALPSETSTLLPPSHRGHGHRRSASSSSSHPEDEEEEEEDVGSMLSRVIGVDIEEYSKGYGTVDHSKRQHARVEEEDEEEEEGRSTFWQALFNTVGDLVGTGLLACPLAIAYCGWIVGPILLLFLGFLTHRTLIILVKISLEDRSLRTYVDIIGKCFEKKKFNIRPYLTALFVFEVFAWTMTLVILSSDTLNALLPNLGLTSNHFKLLSFFLIFPTAFLPLHLLSFTSLLGIISSFFLVAIILFNGFFAPAGAPGSIFHPAPTDLWPSLGWLKMGASGGLFMSLWGGHAIVPSVVRDLRPEDKDKWRRLIDASYIIALLASGSVGAAGYLMFGREVSDEISLDIANTPGVSVLLTTLAVWMVAINPLCKIPMGIKMLNDIVEIALSIYPSRNPTLPSRAQTPAPSRPSSPKPDGVKIHASEVLNPNLSDIIENDDDDDIESEQQVVARWRKQERTKGGWRVVTRTGIIVVIIALSIIFPSFEALLAFLGSAPAFGVSAILPLLGKKLLYSGQKNRGVDGWEAILDWVFIALAVVGAAGGLAGVFFGVRD